MQRKIFVIAMPPLAWLVAAYVCMVDMVAIMQNYVYPPIPCGSENA